MSKEEHHKACKESQDHVTGIIKTEFTDFRDFFTTKIENEVMKSLKNLNGTLEQKIEAIVATQIKRVEDRIDSKLDMIDVIKKIVELKK